MTIRGFTKQLTWAGATPIPFVAYVPTSPVPAGSLTGTMSSTNTIYSNILDVASITMVYNLGLEFTWTGNPAGTIYLYGSNSGVYFYPLTFCSFSQPIGSAGGTLVNLNQYPFHYILIEYINNFGSGDLTATICARTL